MSNFLSKAEYLDECEIITAGNNLKVKPWEYICAKQIAKAVFGNTSDLLIENIRSNKQWIEYATVVLSQNDLRKEFSFLMQKFQEQNNKEI